MKANHKSIGQRMQRAKTREGLAVLLREWSQEWENGHRMTMESLDSAIRRGDLSGIERAAKQLHAIHEKKFASLPGVVRRAVESIPEQPDETK